MNEKYRIKNVYVLFVYIFKGGSAMNYFDFMFVSTEHTVAVVGVTGAGRHEPHYFSPDSHTKILIKNILGPEPSHPGSQINHHETFDSVKNNISMLNYLIYLI